MIVSTDSVLLPPNLGTADAARQQKEKKAQAPCIQEAVTTIVNAAFEKLQASQTDWQAKAKNEEIEADARLEKALASVGPWSTVPFILDRYKLTRDKDCWELINFFFKNSIEISSYSIKNCLNSHIKSVEGRIQLAKLFATRSTFSCAAADMDALGIPKECYVEVIKIFAVKHPSKLGLAVKYASIPSEQSRIEIAKIAAASSGLSVARCIHNFKIKDFNSLREIMHICMKESPDEIEEIATSIFIYYVNDTSESHKILRASIVKLTDDTAKKKLLDWLRFYVVICASANLSEEQIKARLPYAQQIMKLQVPDIRFLLADILVINECPAASPTLPFYVLVHALKRIVPLTNKEWEHITASLSSKIYLDNAKKEIILRGLLSLILNPEALKPQEKADIIKHIFIPSPTASQQKEQKEKADAAPAAALHTQLQHLDALISSNSLETLMMPASQVKETDAKEAKVRASRLKEPIDLSAALNQAFTEHLGLKRIQDFSIKYDKTIGKARNHLALMAYAVKLRSLPAKQLPAAQNVLTGFVTAILEGTYNQWRYQTPVGSHLARVFENREKLLEQWKQGEQLSVEELLKSEKVPVAAVPQEFDIHKYLFQRICVDKHLDPKDYPNLVKCLEDPRVCEATVKQLSQELSKLQQGKKHGPETLRLKLEIALIGLLNPTESPQKKAGRIQKLPFLNEICAKNQQFIHDVEDLQKHLERAPSACVSTKYTVADTDHWEDLLLIGTEVAGSCQRIGGDIKLNKCLLGYLADGKNRAIAVKDAQGKIVARRIMRILWDAELKKPVIYKERLYHNPGVPQEALDAIDKMFIRRAKALNFTLVHTKESMQNSTPYPNPLQSLSSPSPFEYVDAGPRVTDGTYEIDAKDIVVVPSSH